MQAGPCLSAMSVRLLSICSMYSTLIAGVSALYLWWVGSSLVVVCRLLSSCDTRAL